MQRSVIITIVILFFLTSTVKLVEGFSAERYLFVGKWGSICSFSTEDWSCTKEQAQSQFRYPTSIALDAGGNIFVTDSWNDRVLKFTRAENSTVDWGSRGSGDGEFHFPTGIAVDPSGNVYVADFGNSRVQKFTSDGKFITKWGSEGPSDGQFSRPQGVAVDPSGNVYVADFGNSRVQKFTSDGKFITKWGTRGSGDGEFGYGDAIVFVGPTGIAVDPSGNVYVADFGNSRVQKFTSDGKFITKWGSEGPSDGQFSRPQGVAVDPSGNVYVADSGNERIQKFTPDGRFITKWGSEGSSAAVGINTLYEGLSGIAVDKNKGIVYSTDTWNDSIQIFSPITELHS